MLTLGVPSRFDTEPDDAAAPARVLMPAHVILLDATMSGDPIS